MVFSTTCMEMTDWRIVGGKCQSNVITPRWHRRWHVSLPSGVCLHPAFPNTNNSEWFPLFLPQLSLFQLAAATSRYPTISHSSSALPWQQSLPSQLHPSSLALAHQLSHVVRYPPPYPQRHTHADIPVRTFPDITTSWHQPPKATDLLTNFDRLKWSRLQRKKQKTKASSHFWLSLIFICAQG